MRLIGINNDEGKKNKMDEKEKRIEANKIKSLYFDNEISDEEIIQLISKNRELINVELMSTANLMVDAVACNRFEVAKRLVDMGSDINWKCRASMINGNVLNAVTSLEQAEFFLEHGAEIEKNYDLAVQYINPALAAAERNNVEMLDYWIHKQKDIFIEDLEYYNKLINAVVEHISNVNQISMLSYVIRDDALYELLKEKYQSITDLSSIKLRKKSLNSIKDVELKSRVNELKAILKK